MVTPTTFVIFLIISVFTLHGHAQRPTGNKGTGFYVADGKIFDKNDIEFIPYGVNSVHVWLNEKDSRNALENEIRKSSANIVRIVTAGESWTWNSQSNTPAKKKELVQLAINAGLVPMIELHDGTCLHEIDKPAADGKMGLKQIVDHWLLPDNVEMLKQFEDYLMLNIANEWGPDFASNTKQDFLDGYKQAITRLRQAGVNNLLVIDAGGCGQDPYSLINYADLLLQHDPQRNTAFAIHLYGLWRTRDRTFTSWTPPFVVEELIPKLAALDAPVMIGEFGWTGTGTSVNFNPQILLQTAHAEKLGWLFWAWQSNANEIAYNLTSRTDLTFNKFTDLTEAGTFVVNDPDLGFRALSKRASMFPDITHVEDSKISRVLTLYPNPVDSILKVNGIQADVDRVEVVDAMGRLMLVQKTIKPSVDLNLKDLPPGSYVLRLFSRNRVGTAKFLKR